MTQPGQTQNQQKVVAQLEKFGFKFFGYDEAGQMLFIAPNGQVTSMSVAYDFVNKQISAPNMGGGVEEVPNFQQIAGSNVESTAEKEMQILKPESKVDEQSADANASQTKIPVVSPKIDVKKGDGYKPYGDGYDPPFDPNDVNRTLSFIQKYSKSRGSSSNAWIAKQWEKFLDERKIAKS